VAEHAALALVRPPVEVLYTPDEIAKLVKLSRSFVYGEIAKGRLRALYFGRMPRITASALAEYLAAAAERGA
jgi:excisionase family DNA binding protein